MALVKGKIVFSDMRKVRYNFRTSHNYNLNVYAQINFK